MKKGREKRGMQPTGHSVACNRANSRLSQINPAAPAAGKLQHCATVLIPAIVLILIFWIVALMVYDDKENMSGDNFNYYFLAKALANGLGYVDINNPHLPAHNHYPLGIPFC